VNFEGAVSTAEFCHSLHPSNGLSASRSGDLRSHNIAIEFIILSKPVKTGSAQADLVIFEGAVSTASDDPSLQNFPITYGPQQRMGRRRPTL
jgi:hypothetical protein